jgi:hypothetical protein
MSEATRDLLGETMSCHHIDDLVIVVHVPALAPSDAEWEAYVRWCTELLKKYDKLKVLVIAGEQPPTTKQRSLYNKEFSTNSVSIAVLIRNRATLVIVKVFAWFIKNIKAFDQNDLAGALKYLDVAPSAAITETIRRFGSAVGKSASA